MAQRRDVAMTCLVLTIAAGAVALATGAGARTRMPCGPAAAQTLASSSRARVYASRGAAFGCAGDGGRSIRLGKTSNCIGSDRVGPVAVAGEIAAYASERCGIDTGFTQVLVRNLRTGKRLSASPAVTVPGPESFPSVDSLVARPDGAAAWIAEASSLGNHLKNVELRRIDARGQSLLDSGPAIAPRSLHLRGSTLTWRHGGKPRSSSLS
jgi:hypothetical protein